MYRQRVLIFGAGTEGEAFAREMGALDFVGFIDSDKTKVGKFVAGLIVFPLSDLPLLDYDIIWIAARRHTYRIYCLLLQMGIPSTRIYSPMLHPVNRRACSSLVGKHRGSPAFILGNGPSLRVEDLDRLATFKCITFGFNKLYLSYSQTLFRPMYYMVEDWLVAKNNATSLSKLTGSIKLIPELLLEYIPSQSIDIIFGLTYEESNPARISDNPLDLSWGATVVFTAFQIALIMECSPIYFMGVDWTYCFDPGKPDQILSAHENSRNHFIEHYHTKGELWNKPMFSRMNDAMNAAAIYARQHRLRVYNATRGGAMNFFPRVDFDALQVSSNLT